MHQHSSADDINLQHYIEKSTVYHIIVKTKLSSCNGLPPFCLNCELYVNLFKTVSLLGSGFRFGMKLSLTFNIFHLPIFLMQGNCH